MPRIPSRFLDLSNDYDFSGRVIVPTPTVAGQMANKAYLDQQYQGAQGASGVKGFQGALGSNGTNGFQGTAGSNGTNGFQGTAGSNGSNGFQGTDGSNGSNGFQGVAGSNGTTGVQGATGANGTNGFQGTAGTNGSTGVQGSTGSNGTNGFQGAAGSNGSNGFQGAAGSNGSNGFQGSTGIQGTRGFQGIAVTGTQGAKGFQGIAVTGISVGSIPQVLFSSNTADVTVTASVTNSETTLLGTVTFGTKTIPANILKTGKVIRVTLNGTFVATQASVPPGPTFRLKVKLGSTAILDTGNMAHAENAQFFADANDAFCQEFIFYVRSSGSTANIIGHNRITIPYGGIPFHYGVYNSVTVDATTTQLVDITMQYTGSDVGNSLTIKNVLFEIM